MKKNRLPLIIGAIISAALIVSIFIVINYKNNQVNVASDENQPVAEQGKKTILQKSNQKHLKM